MATVTEHTAQPSLLVGLTLRVVICSTPLDSSSQRYTLTLRRSGPPELRMAREGDTNPSLRETLRVQTAPPSNLLFEIKSGLTLASFSMQERMETGALYNFCVSI